MSGGKLDRFCAFRGLGAVPIQLVTNSGGGCYMIRLLFVTSHILLSRCRAVTWQWWTGQRVTIQPERAGR